VKLPGVASPLEFLAAEITAVLLERNHCLFFCRAAADADTNARAWVQARGALLSRNCNGRASASRASSPARNGMGERAGRIMGSRLATPSWMNIRRPNLASRRCGAASRSTCAMTCPWVNGATWSKSHSSRRAGGGLTHQWQARDCLPLSWSHVTGLLAQQRAQA
jgi:hypothetical protein